MKKDNEIDQLFKKGMSEPSIPFNELDWQKMAEKLRAAEARKTPSVWIYAGTGIAAAFLIMLFLFLFDQKDPVGPKENFHTKSKPGKLDQSGSPAGLIKPADEIKRPDLKSSELLETRKATLATQMQSRLDQPAITSNPETPMLTGVSQAQLLSDHDRRTTIEPFAPQIGQQSKQLKDAGQSASDTKSAILDASAIRPGKLSLSILAAPDVTDSKTSIGTKISSNFGLLLTYPVSKKLSVSTGAVYARKLYDYGGTIGVAAYGDAGRPWELNAECFVIDVPLNVNYQVLKKRNVSVSLSSGLSSYFMLKERYQFRNIDLEGKEQRSAIEINNQNQHISGIANFSISVDRKVSERLSIGIQPFLKVPLTGIGYYDYNLRSKGVAVSLSIKPFNTRQ